LGKIILTDEIITAETITNDEAAPVCRGLYQYGAEDFPPIILLAIPEFYKMGRFLIKEIAGWYYAFGLAAVTHERYRRAARRFYAARCLDPEMKEAAECYWWARRTYEKEAKRSKRKRRQAN